MRQPGSLVAYRWDRGEVTSYVAEAAGPRIVEYKVGSWEVRASSSDLPGRCDGGAIRGKDCESKEGRGSQVVAAMNGSDITVASRECPRPA